MRKNDVVAIAVSDLHLSEKGPRCRREEDNWFIAQARPFRELRHLANKYNAPVLCAGDIFHKWNSSAELINLAMEWLGEYPELFYSVVGNHDLPYHDKTQLRRSAYQTLCDAGKIEDISQASTSSMSIDRIQVRGFGWGEKIEAPTPSSAIDLNIAIVHKYIWMPDKGYPGALVEDLASGMKKQLEGYDVAIFGDNHTQFLTKVGKCTVFNHGNFIRRAVDEGPPSVGLIHRDGTVTIKVLACSKLDIVDKSREAEIEQDFSMVTDFIESLHQSEEARFDFKGAVDRYIRENHPSEAVVRVLRNAINRQEKK